jgi:hypothetical protein
MTWAASIHPMDGGLAIRFDRPVQRVEMTHETARELAALLLVAAEGVDDDREHADAIEAYP